MNNMDNELASIITEYNHNLPNKIDDIQKAWDKLQKQWELEALKELHNRIHSLHGSAGMFGYQELSDLAAQLESIIDTGFSQQFSKEQTETINELLSSLKNKSSTQANLTLSLPDVTPITDDKNNLIYMLNIGAHPDNTNIDFAAEISKKLDVFGFKMQHFMKLNMFEDALKTNRPFALLINLSLLDKEDEIALLNLIQQYLENNIPLLFFANSGEFSLRVKAVKLSGKAFLVRPFLIDELIYELDRIHKMDHESYKAIIIDDEIEVAHYHEAVLRTANIQCQIVTNVNELDNTLHEFKPDVILMDYYMPECNGQELATIIRQQRAYEFIPIVFLSSEEDKAKQLNAMKLGGDDFITKKSNPDHLIMAVKNKAYRYKILSSMTTKDNLTLAFNESATLKQLEMILSEAKRAAQTVCLVMIQINSFQRILTEFGNQAADQVLKSLCLMLRSRTRISDIIGKYKNKFLLIFPNTNVQSAISLVKELECQFISLTYYYKNQIFNATFSAGVVATDATFEADKLIQKAEEALSKNPVKVYG